VLIAALHKARYAQFPTRPYDRNVPGKSKKLSRGGDFTDGGNASASALQLIRQMRQFAGPCRPSARPITSELRQHLHKVWRAVRIFRPLNRHV